MFLKRHQEKKSLKREWIKMCRLSAGVPDIKASTNEFRNITLRFEGKGISSTLSEAIGSLRRWRNTSDGSVLIRRLTEVQLLGSFPSSCYLERIQWSLWDEDQHWSELSLLRVHLESKQHVTLKEFQEYFSNKKSARIFQSFSAALSILNNRSQWYRFIISSVIPLATTSLDLSSLSPWSISPGLDTNWVV